MGRPRHISFASSEIVAVEVQVVQDLFTWNHLDIRTWLSRFWDELGRLIVSLMMLIVLFMMFMSWFT